MYGEPIEAVKNGMQLLHSTLRKDPQALEKAFLSVITFGDRANQTVPLTEVAAFKPPQISAGGGTSLGAALKSVVEAAGREVAKGTAEEKGDYKPLVFLMTDGEPTDSIDKPIEDFKKASWGVVVACAAGSHVNTSVLQKIAGGNVLKLDTCDSNSIGAFFKFVSSSIAAVSKKVDSGSDSGAFSELPPPPPEISLLKP
jgi:uncharacterized protein YegL